MTPTTEPDRLIAGDTAKWLKTLADYPATDGWALSYVLANTSGAITILASASGADHLVNVSAGTTNGWNAGTYQMRARVSKAGEVYTIATQSIVIEPAFSTAIDARSNARKILEAVEAALLGTATANMLEYEIAGRRLKRYSLPDLLALRDRMRLEVRGEDAANAAQNAAASGNDLAAGRGRIYVRFGA